VSHERHPPGAAPGLDCAPFEPRRGFAVGAGWRRASRRGRRWASQRPGAGADDARHRRRVVV